MSECHFWWRAGDTQWCDMIGEACHCSGWEESCDIRNEKDQSSKARLVAQVKTIHLQDDEEDGEDELRRTA